jgi:glycosyltransferase involved in cell wall biosynthesis
LKIGIAHPEPIGESTWSGVPAGLARGLRAHGAEVVQLSGASSGGAAMRSPAVAERTAGEIERALRAAGPLDGVVQMGSTFTLPDGVPYVTFEDVTVAQALPVLDLPADWAEDWRARQGEAYVRALACCAATEWTARSLTGDYGVAPERVHVVGFGANLELAPPPGKEYEPPRFLFLGRGWERKNGPAVLRAFEAVNREMPTATLDLVSDHPPLDHVAICGHGPMPREADPEREAARRRYLRSLFERATCFVLPSRFEPYGIAYLEAGSAAVASIGTSVGGAADVIGPGGTVIDPDDDDALSAAMLRLCDPGEARRLGLAARRNASGFTWPLVAGRVLEALRLG